jgi:hypothetical protein
MGQILQIFFSNITLPASPFCLIIQVNNGWFQKWEKEKGKNSFLMYYNSATFLSLVGFVPGGVSASSVIYHLPMWIMFGFAIATVNNFRQLYGLLKKSTRFY